MFTIVAPKKFGHARNLIFETENSKRSYPQFSKNTLYLKRGQMSFLAWPMKMRKEL